VLLPLHRNGWFLRFHGNACIRFTPPQRRSSLAQSSGVWRTDPRETTHPWF
jgi:hypothetical protein